MILKSYTDAINQFKLGFVNKLIQDSNDLLNEQYRPFKLFNEFDSDSVPQNSDVVFMLSQYIKCVEKFRSDHLTRKEFLWYWIVEAEEGEEGEENGLIYVIKNDKISPGK
jgi:hypothetical protein